MKLHKSRIVLFVAALLAWSIPAGSAHADHAIEPFFGKYEGNALSDANSGRVLKLSIQPLKKDGFEIDWSTTTFVSGVGKTKSYKVSFVPSGRDLIFSSAMRRNLFGKLTPMDPLKGDPFVWCKIDGNSLIVYSLLISDDGGYEMQEYVRTLNGDKLSLSFSRIQNGVPLKLITGEYTRVK